jgi:hypothetical protein
MVLYKYKLWLSQVYISSAFPPFYQKTTLSRFTSPFPIAVHPFLSSKYVEDYSDYHVYPTDR